MMVLEPGGGVGGVGVSGISISNALNALFGIGVATAVIDNAYDERELNRLPSTTSDNEGNVPTTLEYPDSGSSIVNHIYDNPIDDGNSVPTVLDTPSEQNSIFDYIFNKAENHHVASDKAIKSGYTEQYKEIFDRAGMKLSDPANIIELEGHSGGHTVQYKEYVLDRLDSATKGLTGEEANKALTHALDGLKQELKNNPRMPYKDGMK